MPIPDKQYDEMLTMINSAIHELVFAAKHLEDDQPEDAQNALVAAQLSITQVEDHVLAFVEQ